MPVRVLVVDDSSFARQMIVELLSTDHEIDVVGEASNGLEAVEMVKALKPDLVTMDMVMPVMDGLGAIERIMASHPLPILVITSVEDAATAYAATAKGALEILQKPDINTTSPKKIVNTIKLLSKVKVITHIRNSPYKTPPRNSLEKELKTEKKEYKTGRAVIHEKEEGAIQIIAMASSTGGPKALSVILPELPGDFRCPVVIVQHIPDTFVSGMAKWLDKLSNITVKPGSRGEKLLPGTAYITPPEIHMKIAVGDILTVSENEPREGYPTFCDVMLSSAANVHGAKSVGVILTGMGHDGVLGIKRIKEAGGYTIAQDQSSSVVFGMPKVAIEHGQIDKVMPLDKISKELIRLAFHR